MLTFEISAVSPSNPAALWVLRFRTVLEISRESVGWKKRDFSLLANPSAVNGTVAIETTKVSLLETNFFFNQFDMAKSSVFNLFSCPRL